MQPTKQAAKKPMKRQPTVKTNPDPAPAEESVVWVTRDGKKAIVSGKTESQMDAEYELLTEDQKWRYVNAPDDYSHELAMEYALDGEDEEEDEEEVEAESAETSEPVKKVASKPKPNGKGAKAKKAPAPTPVKRVATKPVRAKAFRA